MKICVWPDGTRVRFTEDARKAMQRDPRQPMRGTLRNPKGGANAVYTVDNTPDSLHDVILRENGERWGTYWLEPVEEE